MLVEEKASRAEWLAPRRADWATKSGLLELLDGVTAAGWTFGGPLQSWSWPSCGLTAGSSGGPTASSPTDDGATPCTVCSRTKWPRSSRCTTSGARSTAPTASSPTGARIWSGCRSRPPRCGASWLLRGFGLRPLPRPARSVRQPFPEWVEYRPNAIWIYDTTQFRRGQVAATATRTW